MLGGFAQTTFFVFLTTAAGTGLISADLVAHWQFLIGLDPIYSVILCTNPILLFIVSCLSTHLCPPLFK